MKKRIYYLVLGLLLSISGTITAQVTIGSQAEPHAGAVLDLKSTSKGLLLPQASLSNVTTFGLEGTAISAAGMVVFNTNGTTVGGNGKGVYVWDGEKWHANFGAGSNPAPSPSPGERNSNEEAPSSGHPEEIKSGDDSQSEPNTGEQVNENEK